MVTGHLVRRASAVGSVLLLALALPTAALAQKKDKDAWRTDPYTKNDPAIMKRCGYVKYGPLPWADNHDTKQIDEMFPEAKVLWLETTHFRIGSTLPTLAMPKDTKARKRLSNELKQLKKLLPTVKTRPKRLDRWLRLHMYAYRLEKLYAEVCAALHVTEADFPKEYVGKLPLNRGPDFKGLGPYLGMGDKMCVLLLSKPSNLMRYAAKCGQPPAKKPNPIAIHFFDRGSLLFGTSDKLVAAANDSDYHLQAHVQFNMTVQLLHAYRHFSHGLPAWLADGFANSMLIAQHPTMHSFSGMKNWDRAKAYPTKWNVNCRRLAQNGFYSRGEAMSRHKSAYELTFNDQMCSWSRVDYLRSIDGGKKFAEFVKLISAPMPAEAGKSPDFAHVLKAQDAALQSVFGMTWDEFDEAWLKYAVKTYPRK